MSQATPFKETAANLYLWGKTIVCEEVSDDDFLYVRASMLMAMPGVGKEEWKLGKILSLWWGNERIQTCSHKWVFHFEVSTKVA